MKTITEILSYRAKNTPDKIVYTFLTDDNKEISLTYHEFEQKVKCVAFSLKKELSKGERAILLYNPSFDFIITFFACLYSGIIAVPVYPPTSMDLKGGINKTISIIRNCEPSVILTQSDIFIFAKNVSESIPPFNQIKWLCTDNLDKNIEENYNNTQVNSDDIAFLQYTSGSTSDPKGVIVSHENIMYNQEMIKIKFGHDENSNVVNWLPQYHDMGLIGNMLQPIYIGSSCVFMSPLHFLKKPLRWLKAISDYKAHSSGSPNFAFDLCSNKISENDKKDLDLSSWKIAYSGAEPIRKQTIENFYDAFKEYGLNKEALYPIYGLAEATLFVSGGIKGKEYKSISVNKEEFENNKIQISNEGINLVSCGNTALEQEIKIVNYETFEECFENDIGEIWVSGKNITQGYWNNTEKTQEIFKAKIKGSEKEYLRTGDLGFLYDEELYVTGRIKDLIIIRGKNIYPQDIEFTVQNLKYIHNSIRQGCGVAFSVEIDNQEKLIIFQEIDTNKEFKQDQIIKDIYSQINKEFEINPYAIFLCGSGSIPKTSSGKLIRFACKKAFLDDFKDKSMQYFYRWNTNNDNQYIHKKVSLELTKKQDKLRIWFREYIFNELGINSDEILFNKPFKYTLDSITSILLINDLEEWLDIKINSNILKENDSIEKLIVYISENVDIK